MKTRSLAIFAPWLLFISVLVLVGCSSTSRAPHKPSVAILISMPGGAAPSPAEVTYVHKVLQPEIERRGCVIARDYRAADFAVYVRDVADPLGGNGGNIRFERIDLNSERNRAAAAIRELQENSAKAASAAVYEPRE